MRTLFLKKGEERRIKAGHLWVFSNEVDVERSPLVDFAPGQAALVADSRGAILGTAYVNPASLTLIAARLVSRRPDQRLDPELLRRCLRNALALRRRLFDKPFYRLCHSEGDFLPGLVADRHGDYLVLQVSTAGMNIHIPELLEILTDLLHPKAILLDNGILSRDREGLPRHVSEPLGVVSDEIEENGLCYAVSLKDGQKTGWFYDQRRNREAIVPFCGGASVLDVCCCAGGFGAPAAARGAARVNFVDTSARALEFARRNASGAARHAGRGVEINTLKGDALEIPARLRRESRRFDLIILDPPAFIKRRKDAKAGLEAYRRVNDLALDLLEQGGVWMTCSCSRHMEDSALQGIATRAAARRGRGLRPLFHGFQGPDHPVHPAMPETACLKAFLFQAARLPVIAENAPTTLSGE